MLVYVLGLEDEFSLDAPASEPKALTDGDVYTLIGHAHVLRGDGEEDMPKWFMELALRMAIIIGDNALADRVRALQEQP